MKNDGQLPPGPKAQTRTEAVSASDAARIGKQGRGFRLESRAREFRVVASSSGVSRRDTGKPNVRSPTALSRVLGAGCVPYLPGRQASGQERCGTSAVSHGPKTRSRMIYAGTGRSRWKRRWKPARVADVQLAPVSLV